LLPEKGGKSWFTHFLIKTLIINILKKIAVAENCGDVNLDF